MSMLVPNKRPLPEISSGALVPARPLLRRTSFQRPASVQNGPRRLKRVKALHWQTPARGSFDPQRFSGALANRLTALLGGGRKIWRRTVWTNRCRMTGRLRLRCHAAALRPGQALLVRGRQSEAENAVDCMGVLAPVPRAAARTAITRTETGLQRRTRARCETGCPLMTSTIESVMVGNHVL